MGFQWSQLSEDGQKVVLHKFEGDFDLPKWSSEQIASRSKEQVSILVLDVETTGLDPSRDQVIEVAIQEFIYDEQNHQPIALGDMYQGFQDPGFALSAEIKELTGITDDDVRGQHLDFPSMQRLFDRAHLVIAHNAGFDRPYLERLMRGQYKDMHWGCSVSQIPWRRMGYPIAKLEVLMAFHGFFVDAHRAIHDVNALTRILLTKKDGEYKYLKSLYERAFSPAHHIQAFGSPFEKKDLLKKRGYRWNAAQKVWHKTLDASQLEDEQAYLAADIYGGQSQARIQTIEAFDRFKKRV